MFGFSKDHDMAAMHTIVEAIGDMFSFIEKEATIQDGALVAFSVAVQELRLNVACVDMGVCIKAVKSGCFKSHLDEDTRDVVVPGTPVLERVMERS
uniref:Uncharacterized protein n=1 Tax=Oryza punctata TaxID=4537 RepID=A0A0E0K1V4_ORYPU